VRDRLVHLRQQQQQQQQQQQRSSGASVSVRAMDTHASQLPCKFGRAICRA
jgi:hypothetical protein